MDGVSSIPDEAEGSTLTTRADTVLAGAIRGRWSVENRNHRRRDVQRGENRCRLREPSGASALALLWTTLLALVIPENRPAPELFAP